MGAEQERVAREFLRHAEGPQQDVDALVGMMSDDFVWQVNVPTSLPKIGPAASRAELEGQNSISTGLLEGSELRSIASNDRQVFVEHVDVFEMSGKRITLHITGVLEVDNGRVSAWREYWDNASLAMQLGIDASHWATRGSCLVARCGLKLSSTIAMRTSGGYSCRR